MATRERAEAALEQLRRELRADPRIEQSLLWTAAEVWRELAEECWAEQHPWAGEGEAAGEELPLAWFRGLLQPA
jgi:hypothetical protein